MGWTSEPIRVSLASLASPLGGPLVFLPINKVKRFRIITQEEVVHFLQASTFKVVRELNKTLCGFALISSRLIIWLLRLLTCLGWTLRWHFRMTASLVHVVTDEVLLILLL